MHKFGYRDKFNHMVKDVYTNIQSKIKINGPLSDPFTLMREVCHGCLSSMLLYIIAAKDLSVSLMPIKGLKEYK